MKITNEKSKRKYFVSVIDVQKSLTVPAYAGEQTLWNIDFDNITLEAVVYDFATFAAAPSTVDALMQKPLAAVFFDDGMRTMDRAKFEKLLSKLLSEVDDFPDRAQIVESLEAQGCLADVRDMWNAFYKCELKHVFIFQDPAIVERKTSDAPATTLLEKSKPEEHAGDDQRILAISEAEKTIPGLYALMAVSSSEHLGPFRIIHLYLVNNTDITYSAVKRLTGAFSSVDDDLMETGKRVTDMGTLPTNSIVELEGSDTGELDFVVWYDLDMTDASGNYFQYRFTLPKPYTWERCERVQIPGADEAFVLRLSQRQGGTIDDYVSEKGLAPKYFENRDGKMTQTE